MQADEDNAKAIDELEKAYLAKVEELIANDTANANALATLRAEYESKVAAIEKADGDKITITYVNEIGKAELRKLPIENIKDLIDPRIYGGIQ